MSTEKRDQILDAALTLFVDHGFRGTSTAEISKQAGVATGTLFHHFKTKQELIEELYLSAKKALADHLKPMVGSAKSTKEALQVLWMAFSDWAIKHEKQYRFFRHCEASPYISGDVREQGVANFAFAHKYFEDLAKGGNEYDLTQEMIFDLFTGALEGFVRHLYNNPSVRKDKVQWEAAFNTCWKVFS